MGKAQELMESFARRVIESIEQGLVEGQWVKPWIGNELFIPPVNALTKKGYNGGNFMLFAFHGAERKYRSGYWATYKQWTELGAQVRKGETGTPGVKWVENRCAHGESETCDRCGLLFPTAFTVFNEEQVDGWESGTIIDLPEEMNPDVRSPKLDEFFTNTGAVIKYEFGGASYIPVSDEIRMPKFEAFKDARYFYSTQAHELIHWTGAKNRLNRDLVTHSRSSEQYAFEELVAELGATMLCAHLGIEEQPRDDHAQYLVAWLKHLKDDYKMLWKACGLASKAIEYTMSLQPSQELVAA